MQAAKFFFEDYHVGDQYRSVSQLVDRQGVIEFATQWDPQPWHIDEAQAKESMFGGLTACSEHIFSLFCLIGQQWEGGEQQQVLACLGFDEMLMLKPVYAGDTLYCRHTIG